jgi:uncharacterized protein YbaP (TraB family)
VQERRDFSARAKAWASALKLPRTRRALLGAALALALGAPAAAPALSTNAGVQSEARSAPQPALWVVSDADTTIYLFGTFHALDADTGWFDRDVRAAFDLSDELVLETIVPDDPAELLAALARHRFADPPEVGRPVAAASSPSDFASSARSTMNAGHKAGMSVANGADAVLRRAAESDGKPVGGLESFDFQLAMMNALPSPARTAQRADSAASVGTMRNAWRRGDQSRFAAVLGSVERDAPQAYRMMFADRNARWAAWVAERMSTPGTVFVAVGTGHLIGRDSVQALLTNYGYRAVRVS